MEKGLQKITGKGQSTTKENCRYGSGHPNIQKNPGRYHLSSFPCQNAPDLLHRNTNASHTHIQNQSSCHTGKKEQKSPCVPIYSLFLHLNQPFFTEPQKDSAWEMCHLPEAFCAYPPLDNQWTETADTYHWRCTIHFLPSLPENPPETHIYPAALSL